MQVKSKLNAVLQSWSWHKNDGLWGKVATLSAATRRVADPRRLSVGVSKTLEESRP